MPHVVVPGPNGHGNRILRANRDRAAKCGKCGAPLDRARIDFALRVCDAAQDALRPFTIVLIGKAGTGKSSTVNSLLGADVCPTGIGDPVTRTACVRLIRRGDRVYRIVDTEGLCASEDEASDRASLRKARSVAGEPDVVLFVADLSQPRWILGDEERAIRLVTEEWGATLWGRAVLGFTHADKLDDPSRLAHYVEEKGKRVRACIRKHLEARRTQSAAALAASIPALAIANGKARLVDGRDWLTELFCTLVERGRSPWAVLGAASERLEGYAGTTTMGQKQRIVEKCRQQSGASGMSIEAAAELLGGVARYVPGTPASVLKFLVTLLLAIASASC